MKTKHISIIGCGWLGLTLAEQLLKKGFKVKGSSTTPEKILSLTKTGIDAYQIILNENGVLGDIELFLNQSDTLIINVPPGLRRNPNKNHVKELQQLINNIEKSTVKKVLYVGSTSVFEDDVLFPAISDSTVPNAVSKPAKQLIEIENILKVNTNFTTTILRFGGLFDAIRHPAKYLAGKAHIKNPDAPINLIHKLDCIAIITSILNLNFWGETLNAVYPYHPKKRDYYTNYCKNHYLQPPKFSSLEQSRGKLVDSKKVLVDLKYDYKHKP